MVQQTNVSKSPCCTELRLQPDFLKFSHLFFPIFYSFLFYFSPFLRNLLFFFFPEFFLLCFSSLNFFLIVFLARSLLILWYPEYSGYRDIVWYLQHSIPPAGLSSTLQSPDIQTHGALMQINFIACLELHSIIVTQKNNTVP